MFKLKNLALAGLLASAVAMSIGSANATTVTCAVTDVKTTAGTASNATSCINYAENSNPENFGGGGHPYEGYIAAEFGIAGAWYLVGSSNVGSDPVADITGGPTGGNWLSSVALNSPFVITLKAGNTFAAYLFSGLTNITAGTFVTSNFLNGPAVTVTGGKKGKDKGPAVAGLSHLNIYTLPAAPPPPPAVPLPAAFPLLLTGLAGLGLLRSRRKTA